MKESFPGFYHPNDAELNKVWKSDKTIFVFDTNTLLNLYGYAPLTRDDFFSILGKISERTWLPYHVVLEYQRRRLSVVRDEKAIFSKVNDCLKKIDNIFDSNFSLLALDRRFPALHKKTEKLHSDVKKLITSYKKSVRHWDQKQPCVRGHDSIREKLNIIFEKKVGPIPESQAWLDEIYKEGEERYQNKTPPGFKDNNKTNEGDNIFVYAGLKYERRFGDLIIWKQLIENAKDEGIESVIFVTDDAKDDWWYILNSRGEKTIGPRAELREEICRESSINLFAMYNTADFLDNGKNLLEVNVRDESITDAENRFTGKISKQNARWRNYLESIGAIREHFEKLNINKSIYKELNELATIGAKEFGNLQGIFSPSEVEKLRRGVERIYRSTLIDYINRENQFKRQLLESSSLKNLEQVRDLMKTNNLLSGFNSQEEDNPGTDE